MKISVPRERKQGETRVAMTPSMAASLVRQGHQVLVETAAGARSFYSDQEYLASGAQIAQSLEETWEKAELLVKVKEPAPEEFPLLREDLAVFSFLHPAADREMSNQLVQSKCTGLDYDLVVAEDGSLPILRPMSEIAGQLAVYNGAAALQSDHGGRGLLLGGIGGGVPAKVAVLGAGAAGRAAAELALAIGAEVAILDIKEQALLPFRSTSYRGKARPLLSDEAVLRKEALACDLLIGAVLIPGAKAPRLLTKETIREMKAGSVFVDICIDQGGISETSRPTSIAEPTYVLDDVVHYCVPNMPALVPMSSTQALTAATFPYIELLANKGIAEALKTIPALRQSLVTFRGSVTNKVVADALSLEYREYDPSTY